MQSADAMISSSIPQVLRSFRSLFIGGCVLATAGLLATSPLTPVYAADVDLIDVTGVHARLSAIRAAHDERLGADHRWLVTEELEQLQKMTADEIAQLVTVQASFVDEHGVDGLESLLLSTLAAYAARPEVDIEAHEAKLQLVLGAYHTKGEAPPHMFVPLARPGSTIGLHVRARTVRSALETMLLNPGARSIDGAFEHDLCSEAGLDRIALEYGDEVRSAVKNLCNTTGGGGLGSMSGIPDVLSELECLFQHEPTRSEQLQQLMVDCAASGLSGSGNPLADSAGDTTTGTTSTTTTGGAGSGSTTSTTTTGDSSSSSSSSSSSGAGSSSSSSGSGSTTGMPTLQPQEDIALSDVKYEVWEVDADGNRTFTLVMKDGVSHVLENAGLSFGPGAAHGFDNMAPGEKKILVFTTAWRNEQKDAQTPGTDDAALSPECRELYEFLEGVDEAFADETRLLEWLSNPGTSDTAPVDDEFDCLGIGEAEIDDAIGCADELVLCAGEAVPDGNCGCTTVTTSMTPSRGCASFITCAGGELPDENCRCGDVTIVEQPSVPGGGGDPFGTDPRRLDK